MSTVWTIKLGDPGYPALLAATKNPPKLLFGMGERRFATYAAAVVGTRKPTPYGAQVTTSFVSEWAAAGIQIISGLALGIDALAHEAAVKAHGSTIAVLGTGIDHIYPHVNRALAASIIRSGGTIISENPPNSQGHKGIFPERNRIIAGLARATVVIEGAIKSGSLITAAFAIGSGREVFAVPGNIHSPNSAAPNGLLKKQARALTQASDVLSYFGIDRGQTNLAELSLDEHNILVHLEEPMELGRLSLLYGAGIPETLALLSTLELKGAVKSLGGGLFIKAV